MEGNEMNVFVHTHSEGNERDENSVSENIMRHNKSGFRHFVEESTLRNISLDELEELSDAGCSSGADGNIRRTPSSVSSEQAVRFAVILEWQNNYFSKPEGMLRLALLVGYNFYEYVPMPIFLLNRLHYCDSSYKYIL